ncbi:MAG: indole-3-glycerol phosphate synthase TrpC [Chloroflexi bacterium]|nr:indole-3-glycerol phosphate synthase TrpC [Chloroflexota bacterium]
MTILDEIFASKASEVARRKLVRPLASVQSDASLAQPAIDFVGTLRQAAMKNQSPALIAEVKRASPSRGRLVDQFNPGQIVAIYQENGAAAVSVLTDEPYFQGSLADFAEVRARCSHLPLLRKDFICDEYQLFESRAAGADAVLLIAAYLDREELCKLHRLALTLGMAPLIEVHSQEDLKQAVDCNPALIGVNNRDLRNFSVNLEMTRILRPLIPREICLVAESGIHTGQDIRILADAGADAILVGEALMTAPDIAAQVRNFTGSAKPEKKMVGAR